MYHVSDCILLTDTAALLKEILKVARASNQKVADLEKKLQDIQEAEYSGKVKRNKIALEYQLIAAIM